MFNLLNLKIMLKVKTIHSDMNKLMHKNEMKLVPSKQVLNQKRER
uniref:CSON013509 protein n=1 Tax=Culicoides sonorensis TaxID=179676 RepID=A0A336LMP8_CULSO